MLMGLIGWITLGTVVGGLHAWSLRDTRRHFHETLCPALAANRLMSSVRLQEWCPVRMGAFQEGRVR